MKDSKGVEIEVGDTVAVAGRQGSSIWITSSTVDSISQEKPMLRSPSDRKTKAGPVPRYYRYSGRSDAILVIKKAQKSLDMSKTYSFDTTGIHSMVEGNRE